MTELTPDDKSLASVDRALLFLKGRMGSRGMDRQGGSCMPAHFESIPLLYAISGSDGEMTVGQVAEWLCIDPSRASRIVSAAIESGQVTRLASQADGRRTVLELTPAGQAILNQAEEFRLAHYRRITADWSLRERAELARLLNKFVDGFDLHR